MKVSGDGDIANGASHGPRNQSSVKPNHQALVICDLQPDLLNSIGCNATRARFVDLIQVCLDVGKQSGFLVVFTGVQFTSNYCEIPTSHKLYGGFRRLAEKMQDVKPGSVLWFQKGSNGAQIDERLVAPSEGSSLSKDTVCVVWRHQHMPSMELIDVLKQHDITHATVVGIKAAYAVQATCQAICDIGVQVSVVSDCVEDDTMERKNAMLTHLLPIYANVVSLSEFVDQTIGLEQYQCSAPSPTLAVSSNAVSYVSICGRGGHGPIFASHLLMRTEWQEFPLQTWYVDMMTGREYRCPLGKRIIHFCDEPRFSTFCMFLKGREWLDEKDKILSLADDFLPETYLVRNGSSEVGRADEEAAMRKGPWFVKEVDKNGGRAIKLCHTLSEAVDCANSSGVFVVQQHIPNPKLTEDGKKCHLKFYSLLVGYENSWQLFCYRDAFLSVSPNLWSPEHLSHETQITVKRTNRLKFGIDEGDSCGWSLDQCQGVVKRVVERAVNEGKLQHRPDQKQFEIFSADFMQDNDGKLWLIEFNFSPVLYDPLGYHSNEEHLTTAGLKLYHERFRNGNNEIDDSEMIADAISIVFDSMTPSDSRWSQIATF